MKIGSPRESSQVSTNDQSSTLHSYGSSKTSGFPGGEFIKSFTISTIEDGQSGIVSRDTDFQKENYPSLRDGESGNHASCENDRSSNLLSWRNSQSCNYPSFESGNLNFPRGESDRLEEEVVDAVLRDMVNQAAVCLDIHLSRNKNQDDVEQALPINQRETTLTSEHFNKESSPPFDPVSASDSPLIGRTEEQSNERISEQEGSGKAVAPSESANRNVVSVKGENEISFDQDVLSETSAAVQLDNVKDNVKDSEDSDNANVFSDNDDLDISNVSDYPNVADEIIQKLAEIENEISQKGEKETLKGKEDALKFTLVKDEDGKVGYKCHHCDYIYSSRDALRRHQGKVGIYQKQAVKWKMQCQYCQKGFKFAWTVKQHERNCKERNENIGVKKKVSDMQNSEEGDAIDETTDDNVDDDENASSEEKPVNKRGVCDTRKKSKLRKDNIGVKMEVSDFQNSEEEDSIDETTDDNVDDDENTSSDEKPTRKRRIVLKGIEDTQKTSKLRKTVKKKNKENKDNRKGQMKNQDNHQFEKIKGKDGKTMFKCQHCGLHYGSMKTLIRHQVKAGIYQQELGDADSNFQCTACRKGFKYETHLKWHRQGCKADTSQIKLSSRKGKERRERQTSLRQNGGKTAVNVSSKNIMDESTDTESENEEQEDEHMDNVSSDSESESNKSDSENRQVGKENPKRTSRKKMAEKLMFEFVKDKYGNTKYRCQHCGTDYACRNSLRKHQGKVGIYEVKSKSVKVPKVKEEMLKYELVTDKDGKTKYKCQHCGVEYMCRSSLQKHQGKVGIYKPKTIPAKFRCEACDKAFKYEWCLHQHNKICKDIDVGNGVCDTSNVDEKISEELNNDEAVRDFSYIVVEDIDGKDRYRCTHCQYEFSSLFNMKKHLNRVKFKKPKPKLQADTRYIVVKDEDGKDRYKCTNCHYEFSSSFNIKRHLNRARFNNPEQKLKQLKRNLNRTKRRGDPEVNIVYDKCGNFKFICLHCMYDYSTIQSLQKHHKKLRSFFVKKEQGGNEIEDSAKLTGSNVGEEVLRESDDDAEIDDTLSDGMETTEVEAKKGVETEDYEVIEEDLPLPVKRLREKVGHQLQYEAVKTKQGKVKLRCKHCSKLYTHRSSLIKHQLKYGVVKTLKRHVDRRVQYICPTCNKFFRMRWNFERHKRDCSKIVEPKKVYEAISNAQENSEKIRCPVCLLSVKSMDELWKHSNEFHNTADVAEDHNQPLKTEIGENVSNELDELDSCVQCPICKQMFTSCDEDFWIHFASHRKDYHVSCKHCNRQFTELPALINHERTVHSVMKANLSCEKCYQSFSYQFVFDTHDCSKSYAENMRIVHDKVNGKYECYVCKKNFGDQKKNYLAHLKIHTSLKLFQCDVCEQRFLTNAALTRHKLHVHQSQRALCDICGKSLKNKRSLEMHHAMIHPKGKKQTYVCPQCGRELASKNTYKIYLP